MGKAKEAYKTCGWSQRSPEARATSLRAIADLIETEADKLSELESKDAGTPITRARAINIMRSAENFRYFASQIVSTDTQCVTKSTILPPGVKTRVLNYTERSPCGVCVLIAPWNLPLYLMTWKIAPCIAYGNVCVCKPSELTSSSLVYLARRIRDENILPPGVINVVLGKGPTVGAALCKSPLADAISFTGGTQAGRAVNMAAAANLTKCSLELGGKNVSIIMPSGMDLPATIPTVCASAFSNSGQICLCGSRILAHASVYDTVVEKVIEEIGKSWQLGDTNAEETKIGSCISKMHARRVHSHVEDIVYAGGLIRTGGIYPPTLPFPTENEDANEAYYHPTVITDIDHDFIKNREIFGPVVTIHKFDSEAQAIEMANASEYGLAGSVWTNNLSEGHRLAHNVVTGMIWVNCWMARDLNVPFGGCKNSGVGKEGGLYAARFFTNDKNVCVAYPGEPL